MVSEISTIKKNLTFVNESDKKDQILKELIKNHKIYQKTSDKDKSNEYYKIYRGVKNCTKKILKLNEENLNVQYYLILSVDVHPLDLFSHLFSIATENGVKIIVVDNKELFTKFIKESKYNVNNTKNSEECETTCLLFISNNLVY